MTGSCKTAYVAAASGMSERQDETCRRSASVRETGGRGGIRTHGCLHIAGFQDRCIRPLCHPSGKGKLYRKFPSMREFVWLEFDRSVSNVCSRLNGQLTKSIRLKAGHTDCACKQVAFSDRQASQDLQSSGEKQVSCHAFGVMFSEEAVSSFLAEFLNCAL